MTTSIREALDTWDRDWVTSRIAQNAELRAEFLERFPADGWPEMALESYALGQQVDGGTYCWWLEFNTRTMGSISGGSAKKHLIWRSSGGEWQYPKAFASVEEAWDALRSGFVEALRLGADGRFDEVDDIPVLNGAAALRTKTMHMYFPGDVLPVSSKAHIDHFLRELGDPAAMWSAIRANRHLLEVMRSNPDLADLTTEEMGYFLYHWADPRSTIGIYKIAPGHHAIHWDDCLANGYICVGWDEIPDLTEYETKEAFRAAFAEKYPYDGHRAQVSRKANEVWTLMELQAGDKIVANRGISEVLAIGTVTDAGYTWRPDRDTYRHTVGVDWDTSFARQIEPVKAWGTTTVSKVSAKLYDMITESRAPLNTSQVDDIYLEVEEALARRGQVILYGPPGTGKTYTARRAAVWWLCGGGASKEAGQLLLDEQRFASVEAELSSARNAGEQSWFMVANPSQWPWKQLFEDGEVDYSYGRLKKNFPRVRAGDLVIGYESTPTLRVVALARVTREYDAEAPAEEALKLEPLAEVANGITWAELQADEVLAESEPVRNRCHGTLFALTPVETDRLLGRLAERDSSVASVTRQRVRRLTRTTFHPSYTYEDFVEGFRPQPSGTGQLELTMTDGMFKEVCAIAAADPENRYVIVIDEINRGNVPKIFGELITLIEKDKRGLGVRLPQSGEEFRVPSNLGIIATMNTADRSIHLLDTALRRRFAFVELLPDSSVLAGSTVGSLALDLFLDSLNERIRDRVGRERQIGHAIFFDGDTIIDDPKAFGAVFRHELLPLLQEYLYEDYSDLAGLLGEVIIDVEAAQPGSVVADPEELCAELAQQFGAAAVE